MRLRSIFWGVLCAFMFLALDAYAVDGDHYPNVLMDSACTDTEDTPAAQAGGPRPLIQLTGSLDGFCDHDSRILTGPISADTQFGPFKLEPGAIGLRIWLDSDNVTADTATWTINLKVKRPHEATFYTIVSSASFATEANHVLVFVPAAQAEGGITTASQEIDIAIPEVFYLVLNLGTATAWDGNISMEQF